MCPTDGNPLSCQCHIQIKTKETTSCCYLFISSDVYKLHQRPTMSPVFQYNHSTTVPFYNHSPFYLLNVSSSTDHIVVQLHGDMLCSSNMAGIMATSFPGGSKCYYLFPVLYWVRL